MSAFDEIQPIGRKARKKDELWLISYADLVTNLMAVFIMMLAISSVDMSKFEAISSGITQKAQKNTLEQLKKQVDAEVTKRHLQKRVSTSLGLSGLHVEFLNGVLFASAKAELSPAALQEAMPILDILKATDSKYSLAFEGHTDDMPLGKSALFRDNWDLSSARGVALLSQMARMGVPENRMIVSGYAHTRPKVPYVGKVGEQLEQARAANRRVIIRVFQ
jgi:chemotaxis protein MotB